MKALRHALSRLVNIILGISISIAGLANEAPDAGDSATTDNRELKLPFGFWDKSFGLAAGYVYAINAYPQPQASVLGSAMIGTQGSAMGTLIGRDLRLPAIERLFVDPLLSAGYYDKFDASISGNPEFAHQRAGSNDSSKDNFVVGSGADNFFRVRFTYLLPMGNGRDQVIPDYHLEEGLLVDGATGGQSFNPLASGRSFIEIRPFYRARNIRSAEVRSDIATSGADLIAYWDNRDYPTNPSRGDSLQLQVSRDPGALGSSGTWTSLSMEYDHYIPLGATPSP